MKTPFSNAYWPFERRDEDPKSSFAKDASCIVKVGPLTPVSWASRNDAGEEYALTGVGL